jgi:hypothetical protein
MKLNLPKTITFWAAVVIAVISLVIYILHMFFFNGVPYLGGSGYWLLLAAFVLLCLGLIFKEI